MKSHLLSKINLPPITTRVLILLILLGLSFVELTQAAPTRQDHQDELIFLPQHQTPQYVDEKYKFSIQYPTDWSAEILLENNKSDALEVIIDRRIAFRTDQEPRIAVDIWHNDSGKSLEEWFEAYQKPLYKDGDIIPQAPNAHIAGKEAFFSVEFYDDRTAATFTLLLAHQEHIYRMEYYAIDSGQSIDSYKDMLFSLEFSEETTSEADSLPEFPALEPEPISPLEDTCCGFSFPGNPYRCYGGNCTWWAYYKRPDTGGEYGSTWGNAHSWDDRAIQEGFTVSSTPRVGAIAVRNGGEFGHVAYVESYSFIANQVTVSEMNYLPSYAVCSSPRYRASANYTATWFHNYIYPQDTPSGNLLSNPSFEDQVGDMNPWHRNGACNHFAYQDPDVAKDGQNHLNTNRDNTTSCISIYQDVSHVPQVGATYRLGAWVRSQENTPRAGRLGLWALNGDETLRENNETPFVVKTDWQCVETEVTIQRNGYSRLRAELYLDSLEEIDLQLDHVVLKRGGGPICLNLQNASFDAQAGYPAPWQRLGECNYFVYNEPTIARHGRNYLATNRNNNSNCYSMFQDVPGVADVGETYRTAVWVRSGDGTPRTGRLALWARGWGAAEEVSDAPFTATADWQCIETDLTIENAGHDSFRVEFYLDSLEEIDFQFDQATLQRGGTPICQVNVPYPVLLNTPLENQQIQPGETINFDWLDRSGQARDYTILVARDPDFTQIVAGKGDKYDGNLFYGANWTWSTSDGGDYYWKVRAFDGTRRVWSDVRQFTVLGDTYRAVIGQGHGFDACTAPSLQQMQAWRNHSPYQHIGIYIGGSSRACYQPNLTRNWVSEVSKQGWGLMPIWVGPQAPCTSFRQPRVNYDVNTARNQGIDEARKAIDAAYQLGLVGQSKTETIIYYDMEGYNTLNGACRNAVKSFLSGWVSEIHAQGNKAGIYGSIFSASGYWHDLGQPVDTAWLAYWIRNGQYNPNASVYGIPWVSDELWNNHQRIRQYAGDHLGRYGGYSTNIDSNRVDGLVASIGNAVNSATAANAVNISYAELQLQTFQKISFITPDQGWILGDGQLFWTTTGGATWINITPPVAEATVQDAFFIDTTQGWTVNTLTSDDPEYPLSLSHTIDGGQTWQTTPFTDFAADDNAMTPDKAHLYFIDSQTGWLVVKLPSSSNFSLGQLYKTTDGGATWTELTIPIGEPVYFISTDIGWTAGGPAGDQLYRTDDGGNSWEQQEVVPPLSVAGSIAYGTPTFENNQDGILPVIIYDTISEQSTVRFYATDDAGQSWEVAETITLDQVATPGSGLSIDVIDSKVWFIADTNSLPNLPDNVIQLDFVTSTTGWAYASDGACSDQCTFENNLWKTTDGGETWEAVTLPDGSESSGDSIYLPLIVK